MGKKAKFTCSVCGLDKAIRYLSDDSYARAGTRSAKKILESEDGNSLICTSCEKEIIVTEERYNSDVQAYREMYSGVPLDRATLDWLRLNY